MKSFNGKMEAMLYFSPPKFRNLLSLSGDFFAEDTCDMFQMLLILLIELSLSGLALD